MAAQQKQKRNRWLWIGLSCAALGGGVGIATLLGFVFNDKAETTVISETPEFKEVAEGDRELVEAFSHIGDAQITEADGPEYRELAQQLHNTWQDETIRQFLSLGDETSFDNVSDSLEILFDRADSSDAEFLFEALTLPQPDHLQGEEWRAIQRRITDYLVDEGLDPDLVEQGLLGLVENLAVADYVKDSIVRRLDALYTRSQNPDSISDLMWELTERPNEDIASTSLASLGRLSAVTQEIDQARLSKLTVTLLNNEQASVQTRVTAMEVANWLELPEAYDAAVQIVQKDNQAELVQLIAISTIIDEGNQGDISLLQTLQQKHEGDAVGKAAKQAAAILSGEESI